MTIYTKIEKTKKKSTLYIGKYSTKQEVLLLL